jgi:hypothetical protein
MAKKAKKKAAKAASKNPTIVALTASGLKNLGGKPVVATATPTEDSFVTVPGPDGSTLVCFFNPNTGNFDRCRRLEGSLGLAKT